MQFKRAPVSADEVLDAAGGCPTLRRSVFHYLDRYEALRLADASPAWRSAATESVSWLPGLLQYVHSQSTRSITVGNEELEQRVLEQEQRQQQRNRSSGRSSSGKHSPQNPLLGGNRSRRSNSPNPAAAAAAASQNKRRSRSPNASNASSQGSMLSDNTGGGRMSSNSSNSSRRSPLLSPTDDDGHQQQRNRQRRRKSPSALNLDSHAARRAMRRGDQSFSDEDCNYDYDDQGRDGGGSYVAPNCTTEAGHGLFTPVARQHIARSAFGPTHVFSGNPIPGDVLATLWNLPAPELYFLVAQAFRRPPRDMAMILEHCDKLVGLALAGQSASLSVSTMMTNVESQIFLCLQLLCHPISEKRTERRFLQQFPCTLILLRCANVLRISGFDWRIPATLAMALLTPSYFKNKSFRPNSNPRASVANPKNLSPVVLLLGEMLRWHDVEPLREHAPWFAALATWAAVAPTIWTELHFHPMMTLPHVLTLKSLAIAPLSSSNVGSSPLGGGHFSGASFHHRHQQHQKGGGGGYNDDDDSQHDGGNSNSLADAVHDGVQQQEEEMRELRVVRAMLRRNIDAEAIVKTVVQSAVDMAVHYYRKEQGLVPVTINMANTAVNTLPSAASTGQPSEAQAKHRLMKDIALRVKLVFHALAKMEQVMLEIVWGAATKAEETVLRKKYRGYIEREVEFAFQQIGNAQAGVTRLFDARGRLEEAQNATDTTS